jgi:hypothetical protein
MPWRPSALEVLGANSKSAFVPGGLDELGYSVLFTKLRTHDELWAQIGPAVKSARRSYMTYGSRIDPLFEQSVENGLVIRYEDRVPWHLLGRLYQEYAAANDNIADCFQAFAPYRSVFIEGKPATVNEFYRNVGVFFLKLQDEDFKPGSGLFLDLLSPGYESNFKLSEDAFMPVYNHAQACFVQMKVDAYTALPAFFSARTEDAQLTGLGRVLSCAPLSTYFFEKGHPMNFGNIVSPRCHEYFMSVPEDVSLEGAIPFTGKDGADIKRLCGVLQLFKDNHLSVPYTVVERLYGFAHSEGRFGMPPVAVETFLKALPEKVEPYSPLSVTARLLRDLLNAGHATDGGKFVDTMKNLLALVLVEFWACKGVSGPEVNVFLDKVGEAGTLKEVLALVGEAGVGTLSRADFNTLVEAMGGEPLKDDEAPFSYTPVERESLARLTRVPIGLCFLDRRLEPTPYEVIRAGAYFEQEGRKPDDFWQFHMDSLRARVEHRSLPIRQEGVKFHQEVRLVTSGLMEKGFLDAYRYVKGTENVQVSDPQIALGISGVGFAWDEVQAWERALSGLERLEQQTARQLGGNDSLEAVGEFLRLTAACYPKYADFFMAGGALADRYLQPVPDDKVAPVLNPGVLECLRRDMASLRSVGVDEPVYSPRAILEI